GTPDPGTDNGTRDCNVGTTGNTGSPVNTGSRSNCKSAWGVFDMVGNVEEWTADWTEANVGGCTDSSAAFGFPGSDLICFRGYFASSNYTPSPAPGPLARGGANLHCHPARVFPVDTSYHPPGSGPPPGLRCSPPPP